jgi:YggT family protein
MNVGNALFGAIVEVTYAILDFYVWALIIGAVLSWLVAFNVINPRNRVVQAVGDLLFRITEPALRPIRNKLPPMAGVDLSPLVLVFIVIFIQSFLRRLVF